MSLFRDRHEFALVEVGLARMTSACFAAAARGNAS